MFFSNNKNSLVEKKNALVGRKQPINDILFHEINGCNLNDLPEGYENIILGMGCFWGAEKLFWALEGVYLTSVGYAGGYTLNPTYDEVCGGLTGHTEVVNIVYDPTIISLKKIMIYFWEGHNPTQGMRQGNDFGTQYRSAIFTNDNKDIKVVKETMRIFQDRLNENQLGKITTEIKNKITYYFAESYHQMRDVCGCGLRRARTGCG